MKKKLRALLIGFGLASFLLLPGTVGAVDVLNPACQANPNATACIENREPQSATNNSIYGPNGVLTKVARLFAFIVGIASIIMIIIGGFKFLTSSGDPSNVKSAKDTILYALIGVAVAASTQAIVIFVLDRL